MQEANGSWLQTGLGLRKFIYLRIELRFSVFHWPVQACFDQLVGGAAGLCETAAEIRDAFKGRASHGVSVKTYSVTNLAVKDAARRYSPAVVSVSREVESGLPSYISTSYVERQNLTLRMTQKRFARLTNGFSKKLTHHAAAVSLCVTHYNLCRVHEAL